MMHRLIVVHSIDKEPVGANLGDSIPLHMTMLHWFVSGRQVQEIDGTIPKIASGIGSLTVAATQEDLFGPNRDVPVMRIERTQRLLGIHLLLADAMRDLGCKLEERWTGEANWNPHVTHKPGRQLQPGDTLTVDSLDLIRMEQATKNRIILARYPLS
jgi:hypothetical protein